MTEVLQNEVVVEYSAAGQRQTTFGTALADGALTASFRATVIDPFRTPTTSRIFRSCNKRFQISERSLTRYGVLTLEWEATPQTLGWIISLAFGTDTTGGTDPLTHTLTLQSGKTLPVTTIRVGSDGSLSGNATVGKKFKDVAVNSVSISSSSGPDSVITVRAEFFMNASPANGPNTTYAACYTGLPSLLSDTGSLFTVDAVDYYALLRQITCTYNNNIWVGDDPFLNNAGSVDPARWRRGDEAHECLFAVEGFVGDTLHTLAVANNGAGTPSKSVIWRVGSATNGFTWNVPAARIKGQDPLIAPYGEASAETIQISAVGERAGSDAAQPINAVAVLPLSAQAAAFLVAA